MTPDASQSRRKFLATAGAWSAGWLALAPVLATLASCARDAAERGEAFRLLTPAEGRTLTALADAILPATDGLPGATEAGAAHFVDQVLPRVGVAMEQPLRAGLADLDARARRLRGAGVGFADVPAADRERLVREIEHEPFFELARLLVVAGVFADPAYGGNRGGAGWRLAGIQHRGQWQPPFGYYDEEYSRAGHGRRA